MSSASLRNEQEISPRRSRALDDHHHDGRGAALESSLTVTGSCPALPCWQWLVPPLELPYKSRHGCSQHLRPPSDWRGLKITHMGIGTSSIADRSRDAIVHARDVLLDIHFAAAFAILHTIHVADFWPTSHQLSTVKMSSAMRWRMKSPMMPMAV